MTRITLTERQIQDILWEVQGTHVTTMFGLTPNQVRELIIYYETHTNRQVKDLPR